MGGASLRLSVEGDVEEVEHYHMTSQMILHLLQLWKGGGFGMMSSVAVACAGKLVLADRKKRKLHHCTIQALCNSCRISLKFL